MIRKIRTFLYVAGLLIGDQEDVDRGPEDVGVGSGISTKMVL